MDTSVAALDLAGPRRSPRHPRGSRQVEAVREATRGRGADVVIDFVGDAGTPADGLAMLRRAGTYLLVGYGGRLEIPTGDLVFGGFNVVGVNTGTHAELVELVALAERGLVTVTTRTYPLDAIAEAMEDLTRGSHRGPRGHRSRPGQCCRLTFEQTSRRSRLVVPTLEP